jgi:hypothetical protein
MHSLCALITFLASAEGQTTMRVHEGVTPGERFGGAVAALGDLDGDGFVDYGVAAIAGTLGTSTGGVVQVHSGWDGALIRTHVGGANAQEFGYCLGSIGDCDGDGVPDYAVGDPGANSAIDTQRGELSYFSGASGASIGTLTGDASGDRFASSLTELGDVNGDGVADHAIGIPGDDVAGSSSGTAQVRSGAGFAQLYAVHGAAAGDRLGSSMSSVEDVNADGVGDWIVGAPLVDGARGTNCGAAYVLSGVNGAVLLTVEGQAAADRFGTSVCGLGDWDGDDVPDFAVGADQADGGGSASGAVSVHASADGAVLFVMSGAASGDNLGEAIAGAGDVDADGNLDLLVGIPGADGAAPNAGAIVVLSGVGGGVLVEFGGELAFGRLGSSVAGLGRVDYDGYSDFACGTDGASMVSGEAWILSEHINEPPSLVDDEVTTDEDMAVVFNPLDNDSDHDGWIVISSFAIVDGPSHGAISVDPVTLESTYTPDLNWFGDETITYTAVDDDGESGGIATITIHVLDVNDPPVAYDDLVVTDEDVPVVIDVLGNDMDVDGTLVPGSVELVLGASNGTTSLDPLTGAVSYSPDLNWFGVDGLTYFMRDDDGDASNVATCTITVLDVNDLPIAQDDAISTFQKYSTLIDVLANDSDVDGTIDAGGITIMAAPANGTVTVDLALNAIVYLGGDTFVGIDSFTYRVADDDGGASNVATVTVTVVEDCNHNQVWDTDDIAGGFSPDCNATGIPDECELDGNDCNSNGVPDECETDCNRNGQPDDCDIALAYNSDCDGDGVPDDCQVDCNGNGAPDGCDIALAVSLDCDADGLPDECAGIRWVDAAAADCSGDGSWGAPHCSIQDAIDAAAWGETVLVKPGTYAETIRFQGRAILLRGAAPAGAATTIIDAQGSGICVTFQNNEGRATILQGFTVTGGVGLGGQAGGIAVSNASPTIRGCRIEGNNSPSNGGGASSRNQGQPAFRDCVFANNHSDGSGGGMLVDAGVIELHRCHFVGNSADSDGGAIFGRNGGQGSLVRCTFEDNEAMGGEGGGAFLDGVAWTLERCIFQGNACATEGGGVSVRNANNVAHFVNCNIEGNTAGGNGGGLAFDATDLDVVGTRLRGNVAGGRGGGLYAVNVPQVELRGSEFSFNTCGTLGGGLFLSGQNGSIEGCTSSGNVAGSIGGGAYLVGYATPKLDSCILWGDSPDEVRVEVTPNNSGGIATAMSFPDAVRYSCVQGGWPVGPGNIEADPLFRDPAGDFGLLIGSPCIDTGNPGLPSDSDGTPADMGGHPYVGSERIDILSMDFGGGVGLEPLLSATSQMELMTAATNLWRDHRDRGAHERIQRLADLIIEQGPDVLCVQGLVSAHVSPVGDVLSGGGPAPNLLVFDQAAALRRRLEFLGWNHDAAGEHIDYELEVPVATCSGYADLHLRGHMITLTRVVPAGSSFGTFAQQLSGPLGGIGPASTSLGWIEVALAAGGPSVMQTRLEGWPSAGLQMPQAAELASALGPVAVLVGSFSSNPGSPAYNTFSGLGLEDAWLAVGSGSGNTCCQAEDLLNSSSSLTERVDWALGNDPLWAARGAHLVGAAQSDRSVSGRWTSTHAGILTRYATP